MTNNFGSDIYILPLNFLNIDGLPRPKTADVVSQPLKA